MHKLLLSILLLLIGFISKSQSSERIFYGGVFYKSAGLGICFQNKFDTKNEIGKQFDIELSTYHHPQETKTFNQSIFRFG